MYRKSYERECISWYIWARVMFLKFSKLFKPQGFTVFSLQSRFDTSRFDQIVSFGNIIEVDSIQLNLQARSRGRGRGLEPPSEISWFELNSATKMEFCFAKMDRCQWKLQFPSIVYYSKIMYSSSTQFGIV